MSTELPAIPTLGAPPTPVESSLPYSFALVIDNKVYKIMNVDAEMAAVLNAQPTFVQVLSNTTVAGTTYDPVSKTFSSPE